MGRHEAGILHETAQKDTKKKVIGNPGFPARDIGRQLGAGEIGHLRAARSAPENPGFSLAGTRGTMRFAHCSSIPFVTAFSSFSMNRQLCSNSRPLVTRREFLTRSALGIGGLGLAALLQEIGFAAETTPASPLAP